MVRLAMQSSDITQPHINNSHSTACGTSSPGTFSPNSDGHLTPNQQQHQPQQQQQQQHSPPHHNHQIPSMQQHQQHHHHMHQDNGQPLYIGPYGNEFYPEQPYFIPHELCPTHAPMCAFNEYGKFDGSLTLKICWTCYLLAR